MILQRFTFMQIKDGRETVFIRETGNAKGFKDSVRKYANGLLNSHGGIIYFGIDPNATIIGMKISRKEEDDFRLSIDHTIGSFQPFISGNLYRLTFIPLQVQNQVSDYKVIELKVSVGEIGEIYEDGLSKVYIIDATSLIGPLFPQELKELIILKYKESIEGAEEANKYMTPHLAVARATAKSKNISDTNKLYSIIEEVVEEVQKTNGRDFQKYNGVYH